MLYPRRRFRKYRGYRIENKNIDSKSVSEITSNIVGFIRARGIVEPQLCFVLVYAAYVAQTNNVNNADDLLSFFEKKIFSKIIENKLSLI